MYSPKYFFRNKNKLSTTVSFSMVELFILGRVLLFLRMALLLYNHYNELQWFDNCTDNFNLQLSYLKYLSSIWSKVQCNTQPDFSCHFFWKFWNRKIPFTFNWPITLVYEVSPKKFFSEKFSFINFLHCKHW